MTFAVTCHDCDETVWPPLDACGSGGRSEIAALRLALEHTKETGHQEVHVIPGCHYVGDGQRPEGFEHQRPVDADDYRTPTVGQLATTLNSAEEMIRSRADHAEDLAAEIVDDEHAESVVQSLARDCREIADLVENNLEYQLERADEIDIS